MTVYATYSLAYACENNPGASRRPLRSAARHAWPMPADHRDAYPGRARLILSATCWLSPRRAGCVRCGVPETTSSAAVTPPARPRENRRSRHPGNGAKPTSVAPSSVSATPAVRRSRTGAYRQRIRPRPPRFPSRASARRQSTPIRGAPDESRIVAAAPGSRHPSRSREPEGPVLRTVRSGRGPVVAPSRAGTGVRTAQGVYRPRRFRSGQPSIYVPSDSGSNTPSSISSARKATKSGSFMARTRTVARASGCGPPTAGRSKRNDDSSAAGGDRTGRPVVA